MVLANSSRRSRHLDLHQPAGRRDDRPARRADPVADGGDAGDCRLRRRAHGRGSGLASRHVDRPRHHGVCGAGLLGAGLLLELFARLCVCARARLAAGAGLYANLRRPVAVVRKPDPARARPRLRLYRAHRPHHPRRHAGGAAAGFHPHRPRQGRGTDRHPVRARAQERRGADRDGHRHRRRTADRRRSGDGDGVCDPWHRPVDRRCHLAPRLPGDPGRRADVQLPLRARQSPHRSPLHRARPEDPVLTDATLTTAPELIRAAPELPDLLPPVKLRGGILGFVRRHPAIAIGGALVLAMVLIAVFAPYLGTVDPTALAPTRRTREPSALFWFGTDMLGRDIYSRVLYGARVSLAGLVIGLVSGFVRWSDGIIMRVMDGMMSIPPILLAIALMALTRGSVGNVIIAITIAEITRVSRLVRSVVLSLREQPYVDAAIAAGTRTPMIILRHILPNTVAPMTVQATYVCASAMIVEAILSFIGAGTPPTIPSWGNIMAEGRALWQVKPYIVFFPAVFLSVTVLAVNLLGDGLRDALDPRLAKRL